MTFNDCVMFYLLVYSIWLNTCSFYLSDVLCSIFNNHSRIQLTANVLMFAWTSFRILLYFHLLRNVPNTLINLVIIYLPFLLPFCCIEYSAWWETWNKLSFILLFELFCVVFVTMLTSVGRVSGSGQGRVWILSRALFFCFSKKHLPWLLSILAGSRNKI